MEIDTIIETHFQNYLASTFGDTWIEEMPQETVDMLMHAIFTTVGIGLKIGRAGGLNYFKAEKDVADFAAKRLS